ncbi:phage tail protein [Limimaricola variabilis]|uniref:phage tail protein n=1 Tax=Limimaricola variabilis TaxID=1492771 RepID=UPI002AC93143|nr:phage tail protein [Limimaricola variabilis]WPY95589.1 phage tail protein [Limimaricola variabilis]
MSEPMLQLGAYQFSIGTAAYQELSREAEYRWASQERVGAHDALQFTGTRAETIDLRGVIYPFHKGGLGQLDRMRLQASLGIPLPLISGTGSVLGLWIIEAVREGQRVFAAGGAPQRQEFDLRLRRYDGGWRQILSFL